MPGTVLEAEDAKMDATRSRFPSTCSLEEAQKAHGTGWWREKQGHGGMSVAVETGRPKLDHTAGRGGARLCYQTRPPKSRKAKQKV